MEAKHVRNVSSRRLFSGQSELDTGLFYTPYDKNEDTHRHWIQKDNHSSNNDDCDENTNDNPLVVSPNDVTQSLKRWCKPAERGCGATGDEINTCYE